VHLAKMFGFEYVLVKNTKELDSELKRFYSNSNHPKIMEINTSEIENAEIMREYFEL